mmetsp:Transcript_81080/g.173359  ORF Transcript_81080/g.173359 Transcript_81080/m.173359 type:complete len:217 (+) Transcript_81080:201-851(+)
MRSTASPYLEQGALEAEVRPSLQLLHSGTDLATLLVHKKEVSHVLLVRELRGLHPHVDSALLTPPEEVEALLDVVNGAFPLDGLVLVPLVEGHGDMNWVPQVRLVAAISDEVLPTLRDRHTPRCQGINSCPRTACATSKMHAGDEGHEHQEHDDVLAGEHDDATSKAARHNLALEASDRHSRPRGKHAKAPGAVVHDILEQRIHHRHHAQRRPVQD